LTEEQEIQPDNLPIPDYVASRWIHLDNYIFANDEIGNTFADALCAKAAEGVRVRVLHDWFGCLDVPRSFWRDMREAGVEVKAVNPPPLVRR
jgi:cardiolipin synthase A/B